MLKKVQECQRIKDSKSFKLYNSFFGGFGGDRGKVKNFPWKFLTGAPRGVKGKYHKFPNLIFEFLHRGKGINKANSANSVLGL